MASTILDEIVRTKQAEVETIKQTRLLQQDRRESTSSCIIPTEYPFEASLRDRTKVPVIAEIKRKSPSAGPIASLTSEMISQIAADYEASNAACVSVLTDSTYFGGSLDDLRNVVRTVNIPVLRKDFVIDEVQILEAKEAGASAVLLIVAVLGNRTAHFVKYCYSVGMECIVEVHSEAEMEVAVASGEKQHTSLQLHRLGTRILGINNRNLHNFSTDLKTSERLMKQIPEGILKIGESGIKSAEDARRMLEGGETLMRFTPNEAKAFLSAISSSVQRT